MTVGRRGFLQAAGLGAVAVAAGGMRGPAGQQPDWNALRRKLSGQLLLPADAGYAAVRPSYFTMYDQRRPAAFARCLRLADVQQCVDFAASTGTRIVARSGGHSYAGYSTPDDQLVVDLAELNSISVDEHGTAVIGAGATFSEVYLALAKAGRLLPGGSCPSIGVAGLTLGGGISVIGREYGLTCDRLVSARIVTADGRVRTVSRTSEPELFWALRGGGGGNFGIATSFTFDTAPARDFAVFLLVFPAEFPALVAMLGGWQDWQQGKPDALWSQCGIGGGPQPFCQITGSFAGPAGVLGFLLDDLVRRIGVQPTSRDLTELDVVGTMQYFAECGDFTNVSCQPSWNGPGKLPPGSYVSTSRMMTKPMEPHRMAELLTSAPNLFSLIDSFGGAIQRGDREYSPFPHRDALGSIQITDDISDGLPLDQARRQIGFVRDELGKTFGATGYINYIDPEMPDWAHAYYGTSLPRLRQVARKYDPHAMFAFPQGLATR